MEQGAGNAVADLKAGFGQAGSPVFLRCRVGGLRGLAEDGVGGAGEPAWSQPTTSGRVTGTRRAVKSGCARLGE